jgi:hypothetical protein
MPGLVPGIHVFRSRRLAVDVDGRDKPGHDDMGRCFSGTRTSSIMIWSKEQFLSKSRNLFARIESDLTVLKWMSGTTLIVVVALVIRTFIA